MKIEADHGKGWKKRITHWLFLAICAAGAVLTVLFPEKLSALSGYKTYVVLTDSMVPRIPVHSLVLVKNKKDGEIPNLEPQQIITFRAMSFGESLILTHHFHHTEKNENGELIYRTNPEGQEDLDPYETKQEDILGTYLFHIPFVGKWILFLKSQYGRLTYMELFVLFLGDKLLSLLFGEKLEEPFSTRKKVSPTQ